jgi:hypothetical protein
MFAGVSSLSMANPMTKAVEQFAEANPELASRGLGVTTNAERWNGRHAMFGIFAIVMTAYFKGHGLIPDADKVIFPKILLISCCTEAFSLEVWMVASLRL